MRWRSQITHHCRIKGLANVGHRAISFQFSSTESLIARWPDQLWPQFIIIFCPLESPETEVGTHIIFNNQNQNPRGGGKLEGSVTTVSAQMIVEKLGPRIPNSQQSPKEFRIATVIVSEELLSEEAMRLYDYFAARAEEIKAVPYSSGFVRAIALPFHITTGKRGSLMTKIDAPISETKK